MPTNNPKIWTFHTNFTSTHQKNEQGKNHNASNKILLISNYTLNLNKCKTDKNI